MTLMRFRVQELPQKALLDIMQPNNSIAQLSGEEESYFHNCNLKLQQRFNFHMQFKIIRSIDCQNLYLEIGLTTLCVFLPSHSGSLLAKRNTAERGAWAAWLALGTEEASAVTAFFKASRATV
jgi:hypothetical protein